MLLKNSNIIRVSISEQAMVIVSDIINEIAKQYVVEYVHSDILTSQLYIPTKRAKIIRGYFKSLLPEQTPNWGCIFAKKRMTAESYSIVDSMLILKSLLKSKILKRKQYMFIPVANSEQDASFKTITLVLTVRNTLRINLLEILPEMQICSGEFLFCKDLN